MSKRSKPEIWVEFSKIDPIRGKLEQIYLDPSNPRLETPGKERVSDNRIVEKGLQQKSLQKIKEIGITDLTESIRTSGFWTIDKVVLRSIDSDKYVVVEGNRRIAALKTLQDAHNEGKITLPEGILKGIIEFDALIYKGKNPDIAWIIQGFRHTPGIKEWKRYPTAKFLAEIEKKAGKSIQDIASIFPGMKRDEVTKLIRSFYAFEQAKKDEEYGDMLDPDKFGHFYEIIMAKEEIRNWMGWDDKKRKFIKVSNLKKYLSWATAEDEEKSKIDISSTTRDTLIKLIKPENKKLFEKFQNGELDMKQCKDELFREETKREIIDISDILKYLEEMKRTLNILPIPKLQLAKSKKEKEQKEKLCESLEELNKILKLQIKNLKKR